MNHQQLYGLPFFGLIELAYISRDQVGSLFKSSEVPLRDTGRMGMTFPDNQLIKGTRTCTYKGQW